MTTSLSLWDYRIGHSKCKFLYLLSPLLKTITVLSTLNIKFGINRNYFTNKSQEAHSYT